MGKKDQLAEKVQEISGPGHPHTLHALVSKRVMTEERERRRIAVALHDSIGQDMVAVTLKLAALQKSAPPDIANELEHVENLIQRLIKDTRLLTMELSPPVLYELGLEPAVRWLSESVAQHGLEVVVKDDGREKPLNEDVRALLFRGIQELLQNVLKHAQTDRARVELRREGDAIVIVVEDGGVGFDRGAEMFEGAPSGGFGLFHLREQLTFLNGDFQVWSLPGRGTRVTMRAPLMASN